MSDYPKILRAYLTETGKGIELTMVTVEGLEVRFRLDDVAAATLGLTLATAFEASLLRDVVFYGDPA